MYSLPNSSQRKQRSLNLQSKMGSVVIAIIHRFIPHDYWWFVRPPSIAGPTFVHFCWNMPYVQYVEASPIQSTLPLKRQFHEMSPWSSSLDLNYCSSWPWSRDTAPLKINFSKGDLLCPQPCELWRQRWLWWINATTGLLVRQHFWPGTWCRLPLCLR
jgi:hypothetical protein